MTRLSNKTKVDNLFQPSTEGYSRKVLVKEIVNSGLKWSKNGNGRRGIYFGDHRYNWKVERGSGRTVISLQLNGLNESIAFNQTIRKDIKDELYKGTKSNFAPNCIVPLVDNDKEIDHRWGRKDSPLYDRINDPKKQTIEDFQLLSHSHNQYKREQCVKCKNTNTRFNGTKWDDNIGCAGCPLAQPELHR